MDKKKIAIWFTLGGGIIMLALGLLDILVAVTPGSPITSPQNASAASAQISSSLLNTTKSLHTTLSTLVLVGGAAGVIFGAIVIFLGFKMKDANLQMFNKLSIGVVIVSILGFLLAGIGGLVSLVGGIVGFLYKG